MNLEGKILGNRYEIIEKIGNGGMATVYKAKCHMLNRYVAVKILKDEFTTDNEFIKRFNIEAQAVASLTHPNIVSIYDVGNEENLHYIVMELIKGKTLKEIIVEDGILGWKWSVKIAIQIASALETAHRNNIIHRDIKPHNIIITEEGIAKVTDFGIAKAVSNSTITAFGTTIGSVHYFSPEHARGGFTNEKSDLYSLGVVLYEMVTGKIPFDADTPVSVALKHMQEEPTEPIVLNPDIPKALNSIIVKAMQKDPNKRYNSATEMLKDFNMVLKNPDGNFVTVPMDDFATRKVDLEELEKEINKNEKEEDKSKEKKKGKFSKIKEYFDNHKVLKVITLILIAVLIFSLAMGGTYLALSVGRGKDVQIPDLSNMTLEDAKSEVEKLKLKLEVQEEKYHLEIEEGLIISQDPKFQNNYKIKEGTTIKVIVSKGQEIVTVPKVVGEKRDDAYNQLKDMGFEVKILEEYNNDIEKDYVFKQDIAENEEIPAGTTITITVSKGIEQVEVPNLLNKTEADAKQAIETAKLKHKATKKINDPSKPNGVVVDQDITAGSYVSKDTQITITINEFDELKQATVIVNVKSLTGYTTQTDEEGNTIDTPSVSLRVTVDGDTIGTKTVKKDSTKESFSFEGSGTVEIKIYVDDTRLKTQILNLNEKTSITID